MQNSSNSQEKDSNTSIVTASQEDIFEQLPMFETQLNALTAGDSYEQTLSELKKNTSLMRKKYQSLLTSSSPTTSNTKKSISNSVDTKDSNTSDSSMLFSPNDIEAMRREYNALHTKKQQVLKEYQALENRKHVLDAKERIIFQELQSLHDPQVLRVLSFVEQKFSDLAQEREFFAELQHRHDENSRTITAKESRLQNMQQDILARKRKIDSEVLRLQATVSDLKSQRDALEDQRLQLDAVVRERSQLIADLDMQYHSTKSELKKVQQQVESEKALLGSTRQRVEEDTRELDTAAKDFETQKQEFYKKVSTMSDESRHEVDIYKEKVLGELQDQADSLREKEKDLDVKERMLSKLDAEIHKREIRLSDDLSTLEHEREVLDVHETAPVSMPASSEMVTLQLQRVMNNLHMAIVEGDLKLAQNLYGTAYAIYNTADNIVRKKFELPLKELYYKFNG